MKYSKVIIIGGGPAGSTCAWKLKQTGENLKPRVFQPKNQRIGTRQPRNNDRCFLVKPGIIPFGNLFKVLPNPLAELLMK